MNPGGRTKSFLHKDRFLLVLGFSEKVLFSTMKYY